MWRCPLCTQISETERMHSCPEKSLREFLTGKTDHSLDLFRLLQHALQELPGVSLYSARTMIAAGANRRFAYITRIGKNFVDLVIPFREPHTDNFCFHRIAQVPGSQQFNHHFRMFYPEDLNEEIRRFIKMAYREANSIGPERSAI